MTKSARRVYLDFINSGNPKDPREWLNKASSFRSAALLIIQEFLKIKDGDSLDNFAVNAVNTTPYLVGIAAELYMKGYLTAKGETYEKIIKYKHNLPELRKACVSFGNKNFNNQEVKFLTDHLSDHIFSKGGIRYPDKLDAPVYLDDFKIALDDLQTALKEVLNPID